jgi:hypothetical protein
MKTTVTLLLTNDSELEDSVAEALSQLGGVSHLTRDPGDALETVCGVHDLDLAVIDFEHGPHGMRNQHGARRSSYDCHHSRR